LIAFQLVLCIFYFGISGASKVENASQTSATGDLEKALFAMKNYSLGLLYLYANIPHIHDSVQHAVQGNAQSDEEKIHTGIGNIFGKILKGIHPNDLKSDFQDIWTLANSTLKNALRVAIENHDTQE
jgi:hypothetical protein